MSLIPSPFLDTVVAIGKGESPDSIRYIATGFVYRALVKEDDNKWYSNFLVTNRHVIEDSIEIHIRQNTTVRAEPVLGFLTDEWTTHPDPEVDVAVLPIYTEDNGGNTVDVPAFGDAHTMSRAKLQETEFREGNEIFVLGFPLGIVGNSRNYPIVRQGIVARIRDWYENDSKDFLIDSSIFPGNSGGPVLAKPTLHTYGKAITSAKLIGLVSSYIPYQDIARSDQTGRPILAAHENSGLATVVPIDAVQETISMAIEKYDGQINSPIRP